jgi:hypothetical protein
MYKLIYLPEADVVDFCINEYYRKEVLERYMEDAYYFYMSNIGPKIANLTDGYYKARFMTGKVLPKHLFEIIEVPDEI